MSHRLSTLVSALAVAAILSLSACGPAEIAPSAEPSVIPSQTATPSPTPTAEPVSVPQPILDLTCDGLVGASSLAGSFADPMTPVPPLTMGGFAVLSLGGSECSWNNGQPASLPSGGYNPEYRSVQVHILPNASSAFDFYATRFMGPVGISCPSSVGGGATCFDQELIGSTWVAVSLLGAVDVDAGAALVHEVVAAVSSAGPGGAQWSIPSTTRQLPAMCEEYIAIDSVRSITGIDATLVYGGSRDEEYSIDDASKSAWGALECYWNISGRALAVGAVRTLPGGAWAWESVLPALSPTPEPLPIDGLVSGDAAWWRCEANRTYCLVDMTIGGNWVEVFTFAHDTDVPIDNQALALAASKEIVANLAP